MDPSDDVVSRLSNGGETQAMKDVAARRRSRGERGLTPQMVEQTKRLESIAGTEESTLKKLEKAVDEIRRQLDTPAMRAVRTGATGVGPVTRGRSKSPKRKTKSPARKRSRSRSPGRQTKNKPYPKTKAARIKWLEARGYYFESEGEIVIGNYKICINATRLERERPTGGYDIAISLKGCDSKTRKMYLDNVINMTLENLTTEL